jgi:hypothetical protein
MSINVREGDVSEGIDGKKYAGRYRANKEGQLTVSYGGRSLSHALSLPDDPMPLAKELLRRLVNEVHRGTSA